MCTIVIVLTNIGVITGVGHNAMLAYIILCYNKKTGYVTYGNYVS